jgi:hypothetical protein
LLILNILKNLLLIFEYLGMTTGHRIEPKTFRMRKRPKITSSNAKIARAPFGDKSTKILPIPTFIDDYNHYMGGVDQSNQLRASFTTHFSRNQKEFFPGAFWAIDLAVCNSYKLHLALNGHKTSSTGKRDPREHREWVEELVNLLFQVDNDNFGEEITLKPYPKYVYKTAKKGPKSAEKEPLLKTINRVNLEHLYALNPLKKKGWCYFCSKNDVLLSQKGKDSRALLDQKVFKLNQQDLIECREKGGSKEVRNRGKLTQKWCFGCNKFICKDCWSLYH